jgi:two-component system OmpR family sensor kinase
MCEEEEVSVKLTNMKIDVDFKLFSIAIKNLIDNGIKHSLNKKVSIETINDKIIFKNQSKQLKYPLEKYFEPFFKGDDVKSNQNFGLGLYIIKNILDANDFELQYQYDNGISSFIILKKTHKNKC